MKFTFLLLSCIIIIFGCNRKSDRLVVYSLKDSIIRKHFKAIDSLDYFDTTDINYKTLRAYVSNDTNFFKKLSIDIDNEERFKQHWRSLDSCIHQLNLQDMAVDNAYRFIYSQAFCPYTINATLTKKGDSINLHFILYQRNWDTASCRIINEYDKRLTAKNWDEMTDAIRASDFWGLKKENGINGVDGNDITVIGYEKADTSYDRPAKFNYVERWSLARTTLSNPFYLVLKLSGNKQGCIWME